MNIQQYYRSAANTALNESIAALIPIFLLLIPCLFIFPRKELVLLAFPFLLYSFISYQSYLVNKRRIDFVEHVQFEKKEELHLFEEDQLLLTFLPAPSLRMLIFSPEGFLLGELRDLHDQKIRWFLPYFLDKMLPAMYALYDHGNNQIATFKWKGKGIVEISLGEQNFWVEQNPADSNCWTAPLLSKEVHIQPEALFTDIGLLDEQKLMLARIRKGWMPLEWGEVFKDANTPVLSIEQTSNKLEKLFIVTILIYLYRYRNH